MPRELRKKARWAAALDGLWESQYAETYELTKKWNKEYEREAAALARVALGNVPLVMMPAGQVEADGRFPSCSAEGRAPAVSCINVW
jgi:hypothetical protein